MMMLAGLLTGVCAPPQRPSSVALTPPLPAAFADGDAAAGPAAGEAAHAPAQRHPKAEDRADLRPPPADAQRRHLRAGGAGRVVRPLLRRSPRLLLQSFCTPQAHRGHQDEHQLPQVFSVLRSPRRGGGARTRVWEVGRGCRKGAEAQLPQWVHLEAGCPQDKCPRSPAVEPSVPMPDPGLIPRVLRKGCSIRCSVRPGYPSHTSHSPTWKPRFLFPGITGAMTWEPKVGGGGKAVILAEGFPKDTEPQKGGSRYVSRAYCALRLTSP